MFDSTFESFATLLAAGGFAMLSRFLVGSICAAVLLVGPSAKADPGYYPMSNFLAMFSAVPRQVVSYPDKYEPGNHNLVGLAGLAAATDFLRTETIGSIHAHHTRLVSRLLNGLRGIDGRSPGRGARTHRRGDRPRYHRERQAPVSPLNQWHCACINGAPSAS